MLVGCGWGGMTGRTLVHPIPLRADSKGRSIGTHKTDFCRVLRRPAEYVRVRDFAEDVEGQRKVDVLTSWEQRMFSGYGELDFSGDNGYVFGRSWGEDPTFVDECFLGSERESDGRATFTQLSSPAEPRGTRRCSLPSAWPSTTDTAGSYTPAAVNQQANIPVNRSHGD
jgi:hypothetical protein